MKKLATAAAIAALLGASATASAWWGGPWGGSPWGGGYGDRNWMNDIFDMNMNASGRGSGHNRFYDRRYYGYGPFNY